MVPVNEIVTAGLKRRPLLKSTEFNQEKTNSVAHANNISPIWFDSLSIWQKDQT